jgi:hypothetical protein
MRRTHLRGRENKLKRELIHVSAFNLSLIFREMLGAGTPCELNNRQTGLVFLCWWLQIGRDIGPRRLCGAHFDGNRATNYYYKILTY